MASTQQKREWWADWRCNPTKMDAVTFPGTDRDWHLPIADAAVPAFELFADLMRKHGYLFEEVSGGTYNCRKIGGTNSWSLHAYGIAIDLNPSRNPYGTTTHDFPTEFIDDVLESGLFRWGVDFRDPMHWEIDVPPSQIGDDMPLSDDDLAKIGQLIDEKLKLVTLSNGKRISYVALDSTWNVPHGGRLMKDNVVDARKAAEEDSDAGAIVSEIGQRLIGG